MSRVRRFKELKYVSYKKFNDTHVELSMLIPGVNSGAYTPALHVVCRIIKTGLFKEKRAVGDITLSINDVVELRNECNLIIEEAEKQRRLHRNEKTDD